MAIDGFASLALTATPAFAPMLCPHLQVSVGMTTLFQVPNLCFLAFLEQAEGTVMHEDRKTDLLPLI